MTRTELVNAVAARTSQSGTQTSNFLDALIEEIKDRLRKGEEITIHGLGKFKAQHKAAGTARNPRTGETIQTSAQTKVKFSAYKALRDTLN